MFHASDVFFCLFCLVCCVWSIVRVKQLRVRFVTHFAITMEKGKNKRQKKTTSTENDLTLQT